MKIGIIVTLILCITTGSFLFGQTTYENARYKFKVSVPDDWRLHQEINVDSLNYAFVAWGLPKVYSEIEKQEVENAIHITAITHDRIKSVDDLVRTEFNRINNRTNITVLNLVQLDSIEHTSYLVNYLMGTISYVSQQYFVFRNNIGYIITFTATVGTYNIDPPRNTNLLKFEEFYKTLVIE